MEQTKGGGKVKTLFGFAVLACLIGLAAVGSRQERIQRSSATQSPTIGTLTEAGAANVAIRKAEGKATPEEVAALESFIRGERGTAKTAARDRSPATKESLPVVSIAEK